MTTIDELDATGVGPVAAAVSVKISVQKKFSLPSIALCAVDGLEPGEIFAGFADASVCRVDTTAESVTATPVAEVAHASYVTGIVRRGSVLISGGYDGSLIWWDTGSASIRHRVDAAHDRWIRMLCMAPDERVVISVGDDMQTRVWDAKSAELLATWSDHPVTTPHGYPSMLYCVAVSPDGKWVATGSRTGAVVVRDLHTFEVAATLDSPVMYTWDPKARRHSIGGVRSLAFSPDSLMLAVGGMGKVGNIDHLDAPSRIEVFDWQNRVSVRQIENSNHKGLVETMTFGVAGKRLFSAGGDNSGFVCLYDVERGEVIAEDKAPMHVHDFVLREDGPQATLVAVGHEQGAVISVIAGDAEKISQGQNS